MMNQLLIEKEVARDPRLGKDELLVYGAVNGLRDNVWPEFYEPIELEEIVDWTGVPPERVVDAFSTLRKLDLVRWNEEIGIYANAPAYVPDHPLEITDD